MAFVVTDSEVKAAKSAHELFMVQLGALLLLGPLTIFMQAGRIAVVIPMLFSGLFTLYTYYRIPRTSGWFVEMHWRLALSNYRWLFLGYGITDLMLLLSWLVESTASADSPSQFLAVALIRIGIMPTLIMVFVCFVIENHALNLALRHEVPPRWCQIYPPPADLQQTD